MSMEATLDLGDYVVDHPTLNFVFTTLRDDTGAPITFAGSPVIAVYKGSATGTEKDSGEAYITLDIDFDSITGLNHVLIDLSADAFFVAGEDYSIIVKTGTVNSIQKVGVVLAHFSIENRSQQATNVAILADTDVIGALGAGLTAVAQASIVTEARMAELDAGNLPTDVAAVQTTADAIEVGTVTNAAGADVATDVKAVKAETASIFTGTITNAAGADVATDVIAMKVDTAATVVGVIDNATGADVATDVVALKAETVLILADTDDIGTAGAGLTDLGGMSTTMKGQVNAEAKDVLDTDTHAEPGQGTPGATISTGAKIDWLYKNWRNRKTVSATEWKLYNDDAATVDHKATVADSGTVGSITEVATGP